MKLQPQLSDMDPNGAVLQWTVSEWFVEQCLADVLFGKFLSVSVNRTLGNVLQQIAQPRTLLECVAGRNSLNKLPTLVANKVVNLNGFWRQRNLKTPLRFANITTDPSKSTSGVQ